MTNVSSENKTSVERSKISLRSFNTNAVRSGQQYHALVLDAHLRQSLATIRSLGKRKLSVAALESSAATPAFFSRWCQEKILCTASEGSAAYIRYFTQLLNQLQVRVVIPSSDATVDLIQRHRLDLEQYTRAALASQSALAIATSKERTLALAQELGLLIPRGVLIQTIGDVPEALREVGLPAVVKPVESWVPATEHDGGVRLVSLLVTTVEEARCAVEELTNTGGSVLFQQYLPGRREAISFLYARQHIYARFAQWAKRTEPPLGGTSVLRQSIELPQDISRLAEDLVRAIDLEGYSEVEFRRNEQGQPCLMEINPRLSASVEVAIRSGVDFPALLYQWASGEPIEEALSYRSGVWMRYFKGDLMTTIDAIKQRGRPGISSPARSILDFCLTSFRPMYYDYVDWQDPLPALFASVDFSRTWIKTAINRRFSRIRKNLLS